MTPQDQMLSELNQQLREARLKIVQLQEELDEARVTIAKLQAPINRHSPVTYTIVPGFEVLR